MRIAGRIVMAKMWAGVTNAETEKLADEFNSSIGFDSRMYKEDITGSLAHVKMLREQGIICKEDAEKITIGLEEILKDIESGALKIDEEAEDIHMFIEQVLTQRIGDAGKKLHTARSRNDQVALDLRMYLKKECDEISRKTKALIEALCDLAQENADTIMPGYTHLQRAQPVTFGHHLMAYSMMLLRDLGRLKDCKKRMNVSPIGSCALAGTTYDTDRDLEAEELGFESISLNSMDAVSDRDFAAEMLSGISILMMHLSRFSEELILWSSWEFKFIELSDLYTTGSSIMPQKKNPDMAELIRGKCGRVYGDLMGLFTTLKGLPLCYNKDMQEDKEGVFDAIDTVKMCLDMAKGMVSTLTVRKDNMLSAAKEGFINATDLADYLVGKGLPFRSAYKISGQIVSECMKEGLVLETYPIEKYKEKCGLIEEDVYKAVDLFECVKRRVSKGGTAPESVKSQIEYVRKNL